MTQQNVINLFEHMHKWATDQANKPPAAGTQEQRFFDGLARAYKSAVEFTSQITTLNTGESHQ